MSSRAAVHGWPWKKSQEGPEEERRALLGSGRELEGQGGGWEVWERRQEHLTWSGAGKGL